MAVLQSIHPQALEAQREITGRVQVEQNWYGKEVITIGGETKEIQTIAERADSLARTTWDAAKSNGGLSVRNKHECGRYAGRVKAIAELIKQKRSQLSIVTWVCMKIHHLVYGDTTQKLFEAANRVDTLFYPDFTTVSSLGYMPDKVVEKVKEIIQSDDEAKKGAFFTALYRVARSEGGRELPWRWAEHNVENPDEVSQDTLKRALQTMYLSSREYAEELQVFVPSF